MGFADYIYEHLIKYHQNSRGVEPNVLYVGEKQRQMMENAYRQLKYSEDGVCVVFGMHVRQVLADDYINIGFELTSV
jgi:hypothetical protein